jgi:hypothetical protein
MRFMFIFRIAFIVAGSAGGGLRKGEVGSKERDKADSVK